MEMEKQGQQIRAPLALCGLARIGRRTTDKVERFACGSMLGPRKRGNAAHSKRTASFEGGLPRRQAAGAPHFGSFAT